MGRLIGVCLLSGAGILVTAPPAQAAEPDPPSTECPAVAATTFTRSTKTVAAHEPTYLPDAEAVATRVMTVVDGQVVFDQTIPTSDDGPVQSLLGAGSAAVTAAEPSAEAGPPQLLSTVVDVSPPVQVGEVVASPVLTVVSTVAIGPTTIFVGADQSLQCSVVSGSTNVDILIVSTVAITDQYQATATTTTTYVIEATASIQPLAFTGPGRLATEAMVGGALVLVGCFLIARSRRWT